MKLHAVKVYQIPQIREIFVVKFFCQPLTTTNLNKQNVSVDKYFDIFYFVKGTQRGKLNNTSEMFYL